MPRYSRKGKGGGIIFVYHYFGNYTALVYFHLFPETPIQGIVEIGGAPIRFYPIIAQYVEMPWEFILDNADYILEQSNKSLEKLQKLGSTSSPTKANTNCGWPSNSSRRTGSRQCLRWTGTCLMCWNLSAMEKTTTFSHRIWYHRRPSTTATRKSWTQSMKRDWKASMRSCLGKRSRASKRDSCSTSWRGDIQSMLRRNWTANWGRPSRNICRWSAFELIWDIIWRYGPSELVLPSFWTIPILCCSFLSKHYRWCLSPFGLVYFP